MIWIRLLYATPRSMVEVNVIRLKPLMFCLDLLLSMSLYWDFSCQSWGWIRSCVELYYLALSLQIYSVYIEDVSTLVTSNQNRGSWGGGGEWWTGLYETVTIPRCALCPSTLIFSLSICTSTSVFWNPLRSHGILWDLLFMYFYFSSATFVHPTDDDVCETQVLLNIIWHIRKGVDVLYCEMIW